jgi:hypothetical protein
LGLSGFHPRSKFPNLSIAFRLFIILLATTPALAIANVAFAQHVTAFAAAIVLAVAAMGPREDISTVAQLLKRLSLAILFPIVWMVLQIAPLPFSSLSNPIWSTASIALDEPSLPGHISVDPGATIRSLIVYLTQLSLIISAAIIARNRQRAETAFIVLCTVTTLMSAEVLIGQLDVFAGMMPSPGTTAATTYVAVAMLSALTNGALIIELIERYLSRREWENSPSTPLLWRLFLAFCGIAVSLAAMKNLAPNSMLAVVTLGFAVIAFVAIVRRLGLQPWPSVILFVVLAAIAAIVAMPRFEDASLGGIAGFATPATADALALAKRTMSDTPWPGNGVGTFVSLGAIYQDFGTASVLQPPSTAISIAIEWGPLALGFLVVFAIQLFVITFLGAVRRGRDSFFASTAAAGVLGMLCEAFCDPSLLTTPVQTVAAVLVGLGLSQSVGRTSGLK